MPIASERSALGSDVFRTIPFSSISIGIEAVNFQMAMTTLRTKLRNSSHVDGLALKIILNEGVFPRRFFFFKVCYH